MVRQPMTMLWAAPTTAAAGRQANSLDVAGPAEND
jgi:hypothetical protein